MPQTVELDDSGDALFVDPEEDRVMPSRSHLLSGVLPREPVRMFDYVQQRAAYLLAKAVPEVCVWSLARCSCSPPTPAHAAMSAACRDPPLIAYSTEMSDRNTWQMWLCSGSLRPAPRDQVSRRVPGGGPVAGPRVRVAAAHRAAGRAHPGGGAARVPARAGRRRRVHAVRPRPHRCRPAGAAAGAHPGPSAIG